MNLDVQEKIRLRERLQSRILFSKSTSCIETSYKKTQRGGKTLIKVNGKQCLAHRIAYLIYGGEIPKGLQVNHKCNNPKCINIFHLYLGTQKQNIADQMLIGTHTCQNRKRKR